MKLASYLVIATLVLGGVVSNAIASDPWGIEEWIEAGCPNDVWDPPDDILYGVDNAQMSQDGETAVVNSEIGVLHVPADSCIGCDELNPGEKFKFKYAPYSAPQWPGDVCGAVVSTK